jgi:hypothetical protein
LADPLRVYGKKVAITRKGESGLRKAEGRRQKAEEKLPNGDVSATLLSEILNLKFSRCKQRGEIPSSF